MLRILNRLDLVVTASCFALLSYVAFHVYQGPRGLGYQDKLLAQHAELQEEYDALVAERQALDKRAQLLRPETVDPDLVEEIARRDLAMVRPNDRIIPINN